MGFDIYGATRLPWLTKPEHIQEHTREHIMWQISVGRYFRAGAGSWKPIYELIVKANNIYGLNFNLRKWDSNDKAGLNTPEDCTKLADAMSKLITDEDYLEIEDFDVSHTAHFIQFLYNTCAFQIA